MEMYKSSLFICSYFYYFISFYSILMTFKENEIIYYNDMNIIKVQCIQHYVL